MTWSIATLMRDNGMSSGDGFRVIMPTVFPCASAFYAVWASAGYSHRVAPPMFGRPGTDHRPYCAHPHPAGRELLLNLEPISRIFEAWRPPWRGAGEPVVIDRRTSDVRLIFAIGEPD